MKRVEGKVAIVTGAASGMGRSHAQLLAQHGARIVATDLDELGGAETVSVIERAGGSARFVRHNIASEVDWNTVMGVTLDAYGTVDILVNNAGTYAYGATEELSVEEFDRVQQVNVRGTFLGCRAVIPVMKKAGRGIIVNVSSTFGIVGRAGFTAYCASKGAVRLMSKAMAAELAPFGVRVNSLHPGAILTAMTQPFLTDAAAVEALLGPQPIRRVADPSEVSNALLFVVSDDATYVTGAEIVVDGGYVAV